MAKTSNYVRLCCLDGFVEAIYKLLRAQLRERQHNGLVSGLQVVLMSQPKGALKSLLTLKANDQLQ